MKIKRLRALADFLDALPANRFRYNTWVGKLDRKETCGTVCCAAGWLPKVDPKNWAWKQKLPTGAAYECGEIDKADHTLPLLQSTDPEVDGCFGSFRVNDDLATYFDLDQELVSAVFLQADQYFDCDSQGNWPPMRPCDIATLIRYVVKHGEVPEHDSLVRPQGAPHHHAQGHRMKRQRLLALADFLDKLPARKFDYSSWVSKLDRKEECGTVCCAAGWLPSVDPKNWKWTDRPAESHEHYVTQVFGPAGLVTPRLRDSKAKKRQCDFDGVTEDLETYFGIDNELVYDLFLVADAFFAADQDGLYTDLTARDLATLIRYVVKHRKVPAEGALPRAKARRSRKTKVTA